MKTHIDKVSMESSHVDRVSVSLIHVFYPRMPWSMVEIDRMYSY